MTSDDEQKWAINLAFTGTKKEIKDLVRRLQDREEQGGIQDLNLIEGPYNSLQEMLKDRGKNLGIAMENKAAPQVLPAPTDDIAYKSDYNQDMPEDDFSEDDDE